MTKDDMNPTRTKASPVEEGLLKAAEKSAAAETKLEEEVGALYGRAGHSMNAWKSSWD